MRVRAAFTWGVVLCAGCYRYVPATTPALDVGDELRLHVTEDGGARLDAVLGPRTESVDGRVLQVDSTSVLLSATETHKRDGGRLAWAGERVTIPREAIARVDRRALDRPRTLIAGAGAILAGAASFLILKALKSDATGSGEPGPGGGGTPP